MNCRECGKKCGKTICKECEDKIKKFNQSVIIDSSRNIKQIKSNKKTKTFGVVLVVGTIGILPLHLFIWFALGVSGANSGGNADISIYYAIIVFILAIIGLILAKEKMKIILIVIGIQVLLILLILGGIGYF